MNRRHFLRTAASGTAAAAFASPSMSAPAPASSSQSTTKRPNVLLIFADQHNASCLSCAGHPNLPTPRLDRLASEGVRFERAYCPDAICAPSRNALITGLAPRTLGLMRNGERSSIFDQVIPLQRLFKQAGYRTFTTGKRHLAAQADTDWDFAAGTQPEELKHGDQANYWDWIESKGLTSRFLQDWNAEFGYKLPGNQAADFGCRISALPPEATMEAWATRNTRDFIAERAADKEPFFAWTTFYRPHQPYTPLASYADRFNQATLRMPASLREPAEALPPFLRDLRHHTGKPWNLAAADGDDALYRRYLAYYYALVSEIDDHVGTILDDLDRLGLAENTLVIYTSDHGDFVGAHGMIEKASFGHNVYEDTLRVPFIARLPGRIAPGAVRHDLVDLTDLYPTLSELCDLPSPGTDYSLAGRSLASLLQRGAPLGRDFLVSENWSQATIITEHNKLGRWLNCPFPKNDYRDHGDMIFSRATDPGEVNNLRGTPQGDRIASELGEKLTQWASAMNDTGRREFFAENKVPYTIL